MSIGYDAKNSISEVEFFGRNGGNPIYQYYSVPSGVHAALMKAESHGHYLSAYIKGNYRYECVM